VNENKARAELQAFLPGVEFSKSEGGMVHAHMELGTATRDVYADSWAQLVEKLIPKSGDLRGQGDLASG
jgi:hypothetical protein